MTIAYIALGSNIGDRAANLRSATTRLSQILGIAITKQATPIETPAVGGPADSPPYLNSVVGVETTLQPRDVLNALLQIESDLGRVRRIRWEPRVIDLDLILYGNEIINDPGLTVPHPRLHERRFVLHPLAEIAPNIFHPTLNKTMRALLMALA